MNPIPETLPISELRHKQAQVLEKLSDAPVLLTQHGKAAAVLVDPQQWNQLLGLVETLDESVIALEAQIELLTGEDETVSWEAAKAELNAVPA